MLLCEKEKEEENVRIKSRSVWCVRKKKRSPVEGEKVSQVKGDVYMSSGEAAGREMMNVMERSEVSGINLCFFFF